MAEQSLCKRSVGGSSPLLGSRVAVAEWSIARVCKTRARMGYAGSNPARYTNQHSIHLFQLSNPARYTNRKLVYKLRLATKSRIGMESFFSNNFISRIL